MKDQRHYILKKIAGFVCCLMVYTCCLSVYGQDDVDSVTIYADSAVSNTIEENQGSQDKEYVDEVTLRKVPDTVLARMKSEKAFEYANDPAYWNKPKRVYKKGFWDYVFEFFTSVELRVIFYSLLVCLGVFVLYRVVVVNNLFGVNKPQKTKRLFDEPGVQDISRDTIDEKIEQAIVEKDFSVAVRYLFLKTLYLLSDKNWIQFHPEATNNQYLNQMNTHPQGKEFRFLTQVYEYIWYGNFHITEQQFSLVHMSFKNFHAVI